MSRRRGTTEEVLVRALFSEHGAALLAYAVRLAGEKPAGDVVRETLIRAAAEPHALTGGRAAVRAYLFAVVRDLTDGRERSDTRLDSMAMFTAMESLPPEQREVLHALYFQGRDVAETAASLGVPAETVKVRSYHALRRLREAVT